MAHPYEYGPCAWQTTTRCTPSGSRVRAWASTTWTTRATASPGFWPRIRRLGERVEAPAPGAAGTADAHVTTPGRIFGSILVSTDGRRAAVYHTAVHPDMQVKGVGRVLVEAELDALRALGISKAFLVAFRRNATSNAFWERMSFSERLDITYRDRALRDIVRSDT